MANASNGSYAEQLLRERTLLLREQLKTLPNACYDFIRAIEPTTSILTRLAYTYDLNVFFRYLTMEIPEFGHLEPALFQDEDFQRIQAIHLERYLDYLTLYIAESDANASSDSSESPKTLTNAEYGKMRKLATLRSFFKYLYMHQKVLGNVTDLVEMPKRHEKPILRMTTEEVWRMLDLVQNGESQSARQKSYNENTRWRDFAMLMLMLGTGIRVSELVGINIEDVDFENNSFLVTRKGGNQEILYFPDNVADALGQYADMRRSLEAQPGHEHALFLSLQKRRITVRAVELMVKKYALAASPLKKRLSPHKLRSTFGTNLYEKTGDIYLVATVLGHSDVNTTRRHYAAIDDNRRRQASEAVTFLTPSNADLQQEKPTEE